MTVRLFSLLVVALRAVSASGVQAAAAVTEAPAAKENLSLRDSAWSGDFHGMPQRRLIRVFVPYSRLLFLVPTIRERLIEGV